MAGKGCQVIYTAMSIRLCLKYPKIVYKQMNILILLTLNNIIGINNLTYNGPIDYLMSMENDKKIKHHHLKKAGLFNPNQEKVKDPLFLEHSNFFDPCDNLQIRYEMLRSHLIESDSVVGICRRFGLSRQSFYTLEEKFKQEGTAGLLPQKPGPRAPSKLTAEVLEFVLQCLQADEKIAMVEIKSQIQKKFGVSLHRRTIEKLCKDLTLKKNASR
jgi:transposase